MTKLATGIDSSNTHQQVSEMESQQSLHLTISSDHIIDTAITNTSSSTNIFFLTSKLALRTVT